MEGEHRNLTVKTIRRCRFTDLLRTYSSAIHTLHAHNVHALQACVNNIWIMGSRVNRYNREVARSWEPSAEWQQWQQHLGDRQAGLGATVQSG